MSLIEDFNTAYNESSTKWSPWWKEAKRDTEYYLGKQWSKKDRAYLEAQDRDPEVYNRVKLIVSRISGYQRKNRLSMRVEATAGSDQTAAILSGIVQYEMNKPGVGSGYMLMSNAFKWGALCSGLNDIEVYMDYSMDPVCGDIRFRRRPYNSMLRDPYFTELDLSDCRYILDRIWVTKDEAKAILPGHRNTITAMLPKGPDGKFPHAAKEKDFRGKPLLKLDRFYRQEFKKTYSLVNQMTGQVSEWEGNKADLDRQLSQPAQVQGVNLGVNWGQILQPMAGQKRIIKLAYLLDDKEMYDDEDPLGLDDYPFVPVMGYWAPEYDEMKWKLQGMIRTIRDAATQSNKRRMKLLDMMDSQLLGMAVEEDAMVDIDNVNLRGHGVTYYMKKGRLDGIKPLQGPPIQPGTLESIKAMDQDQDDLSGIAAELSGQIEPGENAQSFIQSKLREGNALTAFQDLFDAYRDSKKLLGSKVMRASQVHYSPQKVFRITKKQPTPEFSDRKFGVYDCLVSEGALTDSQKRMRYGEAIALKAQGMPMPWSKILEYSGLEIEPELVQQIKQQEQIQMKLTMGKVEAEMMRVKLQAALDQAKASAIQVKSGLDRAKTMEIIKKLESMDTAQMMKMIELSMKIEKEGHFGVDPLPQPESNVIPMKRNEQMMTTR